MPEPLSQPDQIDALWDYDHPAESEAAFRRALEALDAQADLRSAAGAADTDRASAGIAAPFRRGARHARYRRSSIRWGDVACAHPLSTGAWPRLQFLAPAGAREAVFRRGVGACLHRWRDILAIDAAHMLAIIAPPEASLEWNERALELAERSSAPRALHWRGTLYNNIGWTYHDAGDYEQALATFQKATASRRAEGDPALIRIAVWAEARTLRSLGRVEEALALQQDYCASSIRWASRMATSTRRSPSVSPPLAATTRRAPTSPARMRRFHAIPGWWSPSLRGWNGFARWASLEGVILAQSCVIIEAPES